MAPTTAAYYVTGHGLGHATRSLLLIESLLSRGVKVHIISAIQPTFFETHVAGHIVGQLQCHQRTLDSGAIQQHALAVDALTTLRKYRDNVHVHRETLIAEEAAFLRANAVDLVFVDATPVACVASKRAGCCRCVCLVGAASNPSFLYFPFRRCVLTTNFTWDFVYRSMLAYPYVQDALGPGEREQLEAMVARCSEDYVAADAYWQLPGKCPLPVGFAVENVVGTAPLVARQAKRPRQEVREMYGVTDVATKVLLVGFGGHDTQWQLKDTSLPDGWVAWVLGAKEADLPSGSARFVNMGELDMLVVNMGE